MNTNAIEDILGYSISCLTCKDLIIDIYENIAAGNSRKTLMCANPHSIVTAYKDKEFHRALCGASWLIPDGVGIVLASKVLGGSVKERVTGSDIFNSLNQLLNEKHPGKYSCFFLGSSEESLAEISKKMQKDFPEVKIAGTYSPPFKNQFSAEDNQKMQETIKRAKPDCLWVGMTAPKQEKWILENLQELDVKFVAAVGAVFDFYIGKIKRSPLVFQRLGLEWLPRLLQEPRRLFRRNFISSPLFVLRVLEQRLRK